MLMPFLNKNGEFEELDVPKPFDYFQIPRPVEINAKLEYARGVSFEPKDSVEIFKRKDLAFHINEKYGCRVSVYVSEEYGGFPVAKEHRDGYIEAKLLEMGNYIFTYGERYSPNRNQTGFQPVAKE